MIDCISMSFCYDYSACQYKTLIIKVGMHPGASLQFDCNRPALTSELLHYIAKI